RAELQVAPDSKRFGIAGQFISTSFTLTSSLPRNRANFSLFYDGPADTWAAGLDVGAVVHWIGQMEDDNIDLASSQFIAPDFLHPVVKAQTPRTLGKLLIVPGQPPSGWIPNPIAGQTSQRVRKIADWTTLDLILNYTFNLPPPAPAEVPGFAKDGGKNV